MLSEAKEHSQIENEQSLRSLSHHANSEDEYDKDSFFDDPLPKEVDNLALKDLKVNEDVKFSSGIQSNQSKEMSNSPEIKECDKQLTSKNTEVTETKLNTTFTMPSFNSMLQDGSSILESTSTKTTSVFWKF